MKTTIELSSELGHQARDYAAHHQTTLRALIEHGLRYVLKEHPEQTSFTLRDASIDGQGLQAAFKNAAWIDIQQEIYSGRGA